VSKFKAGDLVIEHGLPIGSHRRKGMIYKVTTDPNGRQWYEFKLFGDPPTMMAWASSSAHKYLEHYNPQEVQKNEV